MNLHIYSHITKLRRITYLRAHYIIKINYQRAQSYKKTTYVHNLPTCTEI